MKPVNIILSLIMTISLGCSDTSKDEKGVSMEESISAERPSSMKEFGNNKVLDATTSTADSISVRGFIEVPPESKVVISPYYGGFVNSLTLLKGQLVKKGQLLVSLTNPEFLDMQQKYISAKENYEYLKADYNRQKDLAQENIASDKSFSKITADFKSAQSLYQSMKEQLKLMNINTSALEQGKLSSRINLYAPISGMITDINISSGQYLDAKEVALEIINKEHLHLELDAFERDISKIKDNQTILFKVPEYSDEVYNASIYLINDVIDMKKRTASIHAHIESSQDEINFTPGMFVEAKIFIE